MPKTFKRMPKSPELLAEDRRARRAEKRHWDWLNYVETYYRFRGLKNPTKLVRVP